MATPGPEPGGAGAGFKVDVGSPSPLEIPTARPFDIKLLAAELSALRAFTLLVDSLSGRERGESVVSIVEGFEWIDSRD